MAYKINHYPCQQRPGTIRDTYEELQYENARTYPQPSRYNSTKLLRATHDIHPNKFLPQSFQGDRSKPYHCMNVERYIPESSGDSYYIVTNTTFNRLDLIANKIYGSSIYWWAIARANVSCLFDPFNIPIGTSLRIPSMSSIYSSYGGIK